jgi:hypothetical protein
MLIAGFGVLQPSQVDAAAISADAPETALGWLARAATVVSAQAVGPGDKAGPFGSLWGAENPVSRSAFRQVLIADRLHQVAEAVPDGAALPSGVDGNDAGVLLACMLLRLMLPKGGIEPETPDFPPTAPRLECSAAAVSFAVEEEVTVLPVEVMGFVKARHDEAVPAEGTEAVNKLLESHLGAAPGALSAYRSVPMPAVRGGALPPPTSSGGTLDGRIWLCLLAPQDALAALRERISGRVLNLALRSDDALCGPGEVLRCPDPARGAQPGRSGLRFPPVASAARRSVWIMRCSIACPSCRTGPMD